MQYISYSALSGIITLSIVNPIWVIKTRQCLQYEKVMRCMHEPVTNKNSSIKSTESTWHILRSLWTNEGFAGLYRGYVPGLFGISHGAIQFVFYEHFKNAYNKHYRGKRINEKLSTVEYLLFSCTSKLAAIVITYPYQLQWSSDVIQQLLRGEGVHGLYKGLLPQILRGIPTSGITFLVYEHSVTLFNWFK
ncbi:unnamed protein product [Heterobilharzia americana]|nr:unnamed protein product [Heterobilharzia americana]